MSELEIYDVEGTTGTHRTCVMKSGDYLATSIVYPRFQMFVMEATGTVGKTWVAGWSFQYETLDAATEDFKAWAEDWFKVERSERAV